MKPTTTPLQRLIASAVCCLILSTAAAQESKTVIGPENADLYNGANALLAGNAEEGVRLTLRGLANAANIRERTTGNANLCAGYILLEQLEQALTYCDRTLQQDDAHWRAYSNRALAYIKLQRYEDAEQDLQRAEAIAPRSRKVKTVRAMLRDAVDPVAPQIVIDDRRQPADDDVE